METTNPKDLLAHLDRFKEVEVEGAGGQKFNFRIQPVPLMSCDPQNEWFWKLRGEDPGKWSARLNDEILHADQETIKRIIVRGILDPKIVETGPPGTLSADLILRDEILASNLYTSIAQLSFDMVLKAKKGEADAGAKVRPNSR